MAKEPHEPHWTLKGLIPAVITPVITGLGGFWFGTPSAPGGPSNLTVVTNHIAVYLGVKEAAPLIGPTPPPGPRETSSGGITARVTGLRYRDRTISANMRLTNRTSSRIYLLNAARDDSQVASLNSGPVGLPAVAGLPYCRSDVAHCITNPNWMRLHNFGYIDPGSSMPLQFTYRAPPELPAGDRLGWTVALIARRADGSGADPSPPEQIRLSFPEVPISQ